MDKSQTECSCNHLTHFAVLMQIDTGPGISEVGLYVIANFCGASSYLPNISVTLFKVYLFFFFLYLILIFFFKRDEKTLEILTYVGLTLSLLGIILTIISYASLT